MQQSFAQHDFPQLPFSQQVTHWALQPLPQHAGAAEAAAGKNSIDASATALAYRAIVFIFLLL